MHLTPEQNNNSFLYGNRTSVDVSALTSTDKTISVRCYSERIGSILEKLGFAIKNTSAGNVTYLNKNSLAKQLAASIQKSHLYLSKPQIQKIIKSVLNTIALSNNLSISTLKKNLDANLSTSQPRQHIQPVNTIKPNQISLDDFSENDPSEEKIPINKTAISSSPKTSRTTSPGTDVESVNSEVLDISPSAKIGQEEHLYKLLHSVINNFEGIPGKIVFDTVNLIKELHPDNDAAVLADIKSITQSGGDLWTAFDTDLPRARCFSLLQERSPAERTICFNILQNTTLEDKIGFFTTLTDLHPEEITTCFQALQNTSPEEKRDFFSIVGMLNNEQKDLFFEELSKTPVTGNEARALLLNILQPDEPSLDIESDYKSEDIDLLLKTLPLLKGYPDHSQLAEILQAVEELPPQRRKEIIEKAASEIQDNMSTLERIAILNKHTSE